MLLGLLPSPDDMPEGTLRAILKQADIDVDVFLKANIK